MASNKPIVSLTCIADENGKCITAGHGGGKKAGRHLVGADGLCKAGRCLRAQMTQCPTCGELIPKGQGFIVVPLTLEKHPNKVRALQVIEEAVHGEPVCQTCAEECNDHIEGLLEPVETARKRVTAFVLTVQDGSHRDHHRKDESGSVIMNFCGCGCGRAGTAQAMMGVMNPNNIGAWCLSPLCFALAKMDLGDALPSLTFRQALDKARRAKIRLEMSTDELDEIEQMEDNDEEQAPMPEDVQPAPARRPAKKLVFTSILDVYQAIVDGERVNFGRKDEATGKTRCVVHANAPELCKCPGGLSDWDRMPTVMRGEQCFGFGAECGDQLATHGVRLETTLKAAILQINGQEDFSKSPRPRTNFAPKVQMEFVNPNPARAPKKRKGGVSASQRIREEGRKAFDAKLASLDEQIAVKRAALIKIGKEIDDLRDAAGDDPELLEIAHQELEDLNEKSDDLLRQVQDLNAERASIDAAGPRAFRAKPTRRPQQAIQTKGSKSNKKDKKKNGNSKAA